MKIRLEQSISNRAMFLDHSVEARFALARIESNLPSRLELKCEGFSVAFNRGSNAEVILRWVLSAEADLPNLEEFIPHAAPTLGPVVLHYDMTLRRP